MPSYVRHAHSSAPLHQISPSQCALKSDVIYPSAPLLQMSPCPLMSDVLPCIRCPHQHAPLHQVSPSAFYPTSRVPIPVPSYFRHPHQVSTQQCAPLHHMSLSQCALILRVPIPVPPYSRCLHLSACLRQMFPTQCLLTLGIPNSMLHYIRYPH